MIFWELQVLINSLLEQGSSEMKVSSMLTNKLNLKVSKYIPHVECENVIDRAWDSKKQHSPSKLERAPVEELKDDSQSSVVSDNQSSVASNRPMVSKVFAI